jgi:hypothetical protein
MESKTATIIQKQEEPVVISKKDANTVVKPLVYYWYDRAYASLRETPFIKKWVDNMTKDADNFHKFLLDKKTQRWACCIILCYIKFRTPSQFAAISSGLTGNRILSVLLGLISCMLPYANFSRDSLLWKLLILLTFISPRSIVKMLMR